MNKCFVALILCIMLLLTGTTVFATDIEETPSGKPLSNIEEFIDDYMTQYIGKTTSGAAVVLFNDGEIIFSKGYGYADIESGTPVSSDTTVFEYGSISKLFVYTTLMRLSEQGKLDLNADIRSYLPEGFLRKLKYNKPITMIDIMNHTTGFEDYLFDVILTSTENLPSFEETIKKSQPQQVYMPGTVSAYSNYAVGLAAYIAQQILGQDFFAYLMETLFLPLEMNNTSMYPMLEDRPELINNKAIGYYPQSKGIFKSGQWSYIPLYPVGAINGTAEDLARFAIALMPEEGQKSSLFENRETLDEMFTQTLNIGPGMIGFSHGFIEWDGEYRGVGHGGNTATFSTQLNIVPEKRFGVIVLTNTAGEMDITSGLTEALIGKKDKNITIETEDLPSANEVEGTYVQARRMHSGFLEMYGYLTPLTVKKIKKNKIQLSSFGQTSTMIQIRPYTYQRIEANGAVFEHNFETVYFELSDGKVERMSGDFVPLPKGRSMPWLTTSLIIALLSGLYFLITPLVLLIKKMFSKTKKLKKSSSSNVLLLVLNGTALIINNAMLILRMLMNNYRSFSEMRIHILLNYPLVLLAILSCVLIIVKWKEKKLSRKQKIFYIISMILIVCLIITLINWQFLNIIA